MSNNTVTLKSFLILLWNTNGLYNHKDELLTILNEKNIDVALISEKLILPNTQKCPSPGHLSLNTHQPSR